MRKYGLIGFPLGHSFSRKYFTEKFRNEWITDTVYENYPLSDISLLPGLISDEKYLCGLNVTIPYKSSVFSYLDKIESTASEIGAVNVIKISRRPGKPFLEGFNSDITGISDSLKPYLKPGIDSALVLGTGGSSKSVCFVLKSFGLRITLVSREPGPGVITYGDLTDEIVAGSRLIVNTTPLGMFPATDGKPAINYGVIGKDHILFDLVYNPEITAFLQEGISRECIIITGLKMLHSQAERAWEIWNSDIL